jgi:broad specificity phosphatase PhoE
MQLILVRHGQTMPQPFFRFEQNRPLSYRGKRQAHLTGAYLQNATVDLLISSNLDRARDTAQIVATYINLPLEVRPEFGEQDVGHWNGLSIDEVRHHFVGELEAWEQDQFHCRRGGESFTELERRVLAAIQCLSEANREQTVLMVCHTGVIRATLSVLGCLRREVAHTQMIEHCAITKLMVASSSTQLLALNETTHLAQDHAFVDRLKSRHLI